MGKLIDWALDKIDLLPSVPGPFLVAFIIVAVLVAPTIRRAWTAKIEHPAGPTEAVPIVTLNAGSVYTVLINIEMQLMKLTERVESVEKTLSRRQRRKPKKPT